MKLRRDFHINVQNHRNVEIQNHIFTQVTDSFKWRYIAIISNLKFTCIDEKVPIEIFKFLKSEFEKHFHVFYRLCFLYLLWIKTVQESIGHFIDSFSVRYIPKKKMTSKVGEDGSNQINRQCKLKLSTNLTHDMLLMQINTFLQKEVHISNMWNFSRLNVQIWK